MNNQLQPTYNPQIGQPQPQNQLPNGQSSPDFPPPPQITS
ncbi:hypothetical protein HMPREF0578_1037 [Mobiluncus mulieris 28-1]|nr:hypothetical protein HMPREF0577_0403 [Mobiluncus mulieris ATCC 35243]EEZ91795.1 hypothetical protein HMPREF0578_1037 [Mobiluncus mulieris 28-1]EFN92265.1 hypothetical protein HMPREF9278_1864 [Mobiluncus mulieris FB024-16]